jgi:hypothetical protein
MSTTICLAWDNKASGDIQQELSCIATSYGYALSFQEEDVHEEARDALVFFLRATKLSGFSLVKCPVDDPYGFGFGIVEEFRALENKGIRPPFFDFLERVSKLLCAITSSFYICFSGEWLLSDLVELIEGDLNTAFHLLSRPGNCQRRLYNVRAGWYQDDDSTPLVLHVSCRPR